MNIIGYINSLLTPGTINSVFTLIRYEVSKQTEEQTNFFFGVYGNSIKSDVRASVEMESDSDCNHGSGYQVFRCNIF